MSDNVTAVLLTLIMFLPFILMAWYDGRRR